MNNLYESIIKRLLEAAEDAPSAEGLAMSRIGTSRGATMTLYRPEVLLSTQASPAVARDVLAQEKLFVKSVVGFASVGQYGRGDCNNAWMVELMAGKGFGKILYGCCYAAAHPNDLIADRMSVTSDASQAWKKAFNSGRPKKQLDTRPGEKMQITPDDPTDDCDLHVPSDEDCKGRDRPWLNYSYSAMGWEVPLLKNLETTHKETLKQATSNNLNFLTTSAIEYALREAGYMFFRYHYKPNG